MLSEDNFSVLGLAAGQRTHGQPLDTLDEYHGFTSFDRAGSTYSLKSDSTCETDGIYRPENFIPDEVYAMIRIWEQSLLKQKEQTLSFNSMDTDSSTDFRANEDSLDPMQWMSESEPPPKRFYRTFWKSVTQRTLQLKRSTAINRAVTSSFDASDDGSSTPRST
jgi:hypothetical protein